MKAALPVAWDTSIGIASLVPRVGERYSYSLPLHSTILKQTAVSIRAVSDRKPGK
jgi:hypothetical protein